MEKIRDDDDDDSGSIREKGEKGNAFLSIIDSNQ